MVKKYINTYLSIKMLFHKIFSNSVFALYIISSNLMITIFITQLRLFAIYLHFNTLEPLIPNYYSMFCLL